jgi:pilus assembly protein CpaD
MTSFFPAPTRHRRTPALRVLAAMGLVASLAGCVTKEAAVEPYPNDYRERHPITLTEGVQTVEIFLGRNRGGLTPSQRADVLAFAQTWRRDATGGIVIDVPHGGPADRAASDTLREVHSILAASGVPAKAVFVRGYRPSGAALASIKINYSKLIATAGPCGQWPQDLGPSKDPAYVENRNYWNLGCASQRNLAAMVDNPADLVQPRGEAPAYTARRTVAIDKYRKGEIPGGTYPSDSGNGYDNGRLSDVGK